MPSTNISEALTRLRDELKRKQQEIRDTGPAPSAMGGVIRAEMDALWSAVELIGRALDERA